MSSLQRNRRKCVEQRSLELKYHAESQRYIDHEFYGDISEDTLEAAAASMDLPPDDGEADGKVLASDVAKKLDFNHLTEETKNQIVRVVSTSGVVEGFISEQNMANKSFGRCLRSAFLCEYRAATERGLGGDALFDAIHKGIMARIRDRKGKGAALPMLAHLFLICDVFMNPDLEQGGNAE